MRHPLRWRLALWMRSRLSLVSWRCDAWRSWPRHRTTSSPSPSAVSWAARKYLVRSRSSSTSIVPARLSSLFSMTVAVRSSQKNTRQAGLSQPKALGNHQVPTTQGQTKPRSICSGIEKHTLRTADASVDVPCSCCTFLLALRYCWHHKFPVETNFALAELASSRREHTFGHG